jgi:hypothetical protein
MKNRLMVLAIGAVTAFAPARAWADSITFSLTAPNGDLSPYTGPYALVVVNRTSTTTATITFNSLAFGGHEYLMGAEGAVGVNVNATSFTPAPATGSNSFAGFTPGPYSFGAPGNEDGFGSFNFTIDSFDSYTHSATQISFSLTNNSGTWATATDVLKLNDNSQLAAAHILVCATTVCDPTVDALKTGYAAGNGTIPLTGVPEPATIMLFGSGLLALAARVRRRRR